MTFVLLALVGAPAAGAFWSAGVGRRGVEARHPVSWAPSIASIVSLLAGAALAVAVSTGSRPTVGDPARPWLRGDELAVLLSVTVAFLGLTVQAYAARNLHLDRLAWRFHATAGCLLTGTLLMGVAARFSVLVVGWMITTVAVVVLLAHRGDGAGRGAARRAAWSLGVGDAALLTAFAVVVAVVGDPDLRGIGDAAAALARRELAPIGLLPAVDAATVVGVLLAMAAAARAAQVVVPAWLPGTLAAPTPVSALLHAGVVNAGGFLLIRFGAVLGVAPVVAWLLAACAISTMAAAAGAAFVRHDVKGVLAASTSAQMAFMLFAVAVGAPLAAITHLVGHAFYKAARFLGAGDAIRAAVADRRQATVHAAMAPGPRAALSVLLPVASLFLLWAVTAPDVLHGADGWIVGAATTAAAVHAVSTWLRRASGSLAARTAAAFASILLIVGGYLALASVIERFVVPTLDRGGAGFVDPRAGLAAVAVVFTVGYVVAHHPRGGPRLFAVMAGAGQAPGLPPPPLPRWEPINPVNPAEAASVTALEVIR